MRQQMAAINIDEMRKALADLERAVAAGFVASEAVFYLKAGNTVWNTGTFADICEKGHPADPRLNWGRDNYLVRKGYRFADGKLIEPPC